MNRADDLLRSVLQDLTSPHSLSSALGFGGFASDQDRSYLFNTCPSPMTVHAGYAGKESHQICGCLMVIQRVVSSGHGASTQGLLEHHDCLHQVVHERLGELLRVLKCVIAKHPTLNSVDILTAAGTLIAKVKGVNFKQVNEDSEREVLAEIYPSIDTLAFTFGNVVSDFLMGDVENGSSLRLAQTRRSRSSENLSVELGRDSSEKNDPLGPASPMRALELDDVLQHSESGVESALLYAKAWSKYTKELLNWVDKRLSMDVECAKSLAKMAESAKTLASQQVTVNWFQMQQAQVVSLPVNNQSLCESAKLYEPGQRYTQYGKSLTPHTNPHQSFHYDITRTQSSGSPVTKRSISTSLSSQVSITSADGLSSDEVDAPAPSHMAKIAQRRSHSSTDIQALRIQVPLKPWMTAGQGGGMCSDSESAGGSSESRSMDSPTASPGLKAHAGVYTSDQMRLDAVGVLSGSELKAGRFREHVDTMKLISTIFCPAVGDFKRRLPRTPSTGTMSSADDLDDRELPSPSDNGLSEMVTETASSPGPFRNTQMSKAAQTHKLRKLRAPSKCRECDSLVVFHGAECEECSLACHKKCLETLAIQCGHKKLQGKLHLFAVDFAQAARNSPDGIPFIIKKCTSEIENRALGIKGIYRVNGAKSRVEKLCQAFENGKDLVELSDLYPHDISNVLKLYLRQLPEPLILFRYYNDFIGLAKESQSIIMEEVEASRSGSCSDPVQIGVDLKRVLLKIKDLLRQLPSTHHKTLQFLIRHLHRVTEKADENKMTASNLGIIFGPTLIKPRQTDAEVSLSSLVDYPYQALIVELLIRHYELIFDSPLSPVDENSPLIIKSCFSPQEKEQRLNRHSRSLMDIKEQHHSAKAYKRHSSVIPSTHLLEEVKEVKAMPDGTDFAPAEPEVVNGVLSSSAPEVRNSPRLIRQNHVSRVQLRPRARASSRPVSLPPERLLNARNTASDPTMEQGRDPDIEEVSEEEKPKGRAAYHYRNTYIDTHTLRRTWDKQYKHYGVTPRTAMIIAKLPGPTEINSVTIFPASTPSCPNTCKSTTDVSKTDVVDYSHVQNAFRPPRTLQPPPGTFYKPPGTRDKMFTLDQTSERQQTLAEKSTTTKEEVTTANSIEDEEENEDDDVEEGVDEEEYGLEVSVDEDPAQDPELSPVQTKPVYPRLRTRHMQDFENREAHFV
ncbi:Rho GTPase-activating protein 29 [Bagarius yarrelli]|uniref:Rho GTPase-activating protein 29 n=1 Tax=Bagarius yarrelli TaxID=175774 RepID=A0A556V4S4_BAGYA|nr:Rho GTPase-activating protein 29 [Bagarius yarrelli]